METGRLYVIAKGNLATFVRTKNGYWFSLDYKHFACAKINFESKILDFTETNDLKIN